ncbi:thioredoxin-like protein [Mycena amicta]|nr:thioredoxin-like protein [Mycena amicta]
MISSQHHLPSCHHELEHLHASRPAGHPSPPAQTTETPASVTQIDNFQDLQKFISESKLKSTVINFGSKSGCPGCHMIKPYWHELSATFHDRVNFIHCNLSETEATDAAQHYKVGAMPTFVFLKGDLEIDRVLGSNKPRLLDGVNRLAGKRRNSGRL